MTDADRIVVLEGALAHTEREVERLLSLLETANIHAAGENKARLAAEAERDRLRAEVADANETLLGTLQNNKDYRAEIDRLRELLREVRDDLADYKLLDDDRISIAMHRIDAELKEQKK